MVRVFETDILIKKINDAIEDAWLTRPGIIWQQEQNSGCEYCREAFWNKLIQPENDKRGHALIDRRNKVLSTRMPDGGSFEIKIGYCPMCGRKL